MTFANESDLWKALHEGHSITNPAIEGSVCCKHGEVFHVVNGKEEKANFWFTAPEMWSLGTAHNWYDNIPECGVLCWVWDTYPEYRLILLVEEKCTGKFEYRTGGNLWKNAIPLTNEEVAKYIYKGADV